MELENKEVLKRLGDQEREIEYIKRELLHVVEQPKRKASLFGCVRGGDVSEEEVEEAKKGLFRELEDI